MKKNESLFRVVTGNGQFKKLIYFNILQVVDKYWLLVYAGCLTQRMRKVNNQNKLGEKFIVWSFNHIFG